MNVSEALASRMSCRAFLPTPVPETTVRAILDGAKQAPSGGNLQPWRVYALSGEPLMGGHGTEGVEWYRDALASDTGLINRRRYILHPRGVKFTSAAVAADSPTNAELENGANWTRVFENKNVRIVAIEHNN